MKRLFISSLICFVFMSVVLACPKIYSQEQAVPDFLNSEIDKYIKNLQLLEPRSAFVIALIDRENVNYFCYQGAGQDDVVKINEKTLFEIGSVTKVFTALLTMILEEQNKISLNDNIRKYIPEASLIPFYNNKEIFINALLTHTSGLPVLPDNFSPKDRQNPYQDYTAELLYAYLNKYLLSVDPAKKVEYVYSNLGYGLLGHVLELASNQNYCELLKKNILEPLGMENTFTNIPEYINNYAIGYSQGYQVPYWDFDVLKGLGVLKSNAQDLARFLLVNLQEIPSHVYPILERMRVVKFPTNIDFINIGLGWHIYKKDDINLVWHGGGTGGFRSFIGFEPEKKKGVVLLTNNVFSTSIIIMLGAHLVNENIALTPLRPFVDLPEDILSKYVGKYANICKDSIYSLYVTLKNGRLYVNIPSFSKNFVVFSETEELFYYDQYDEEDPVEIKFKLDRGKNKVRGLIFKQSGQEIEFKRIKCQ